MKNCCKGAQLNIQISQCSVATYINWGGRVCFFQVIRSLRATVEELLKSDHICHQSYRKNRSGFILSGTHV